MPPSDENQRYQSIFESASDGLIVTEFETSSWSKPILLPAQRGSLWLWHQRPADIGYEGQHDQKKHVQSGFRHLAPLGVKHGCHEH
jgi:hypothetical protein